MKELYSATETSEVLSVSPSTVRSWIHQGRLPVIRLGRRVMVRKVVIDEILKNGLEAVEKPCEPISLKGETWSFEVFENAKD
ncbi:MAG: helix-turn-helix domain-containing protein [Deltaproteobacteria bacterium]|jgi:excisionase family DNA binding protein|nr:helix-turn-helix domain-containing protein [SAR324 cluster bacterium]MEE1577193.1 helix-turn-helix domain-containing protein [Deltaproteobacteria bacterium]|tara:strand:+ start:138 stop:383 length:246 start_codon:yes stop_codon:yes gene_type:complete